MKINIYTIIEVFDALIKIKLLWNDNFGTHFKIAIKVYILLTMGSYVI